MKKICLIFILLQLLAACGDGTTPATDNTDTTTNSNNSSNPDNQNTNLDNQTTTALANGFCAAQTELQMVSTGLLSAYSPKGNGSDLNYCGGEIILSEDDPNFDIAINDYCFNFRNQELTLNGNITGAIESGANFTSDISEITINGEGVDLSITGRTWDGRADDMFLSITVTDQISGKTVALDDVSIKKGEFDFGYVTFPDLGQFEFKFIEHFNADLTQGQLFFYGKGDELVIITAENGTITVVHKTTKQDPGTLIESNCGG